MTGFEILIPFVLFFSAWAFITIRRANARRNDYIKEQTENPWPRLLQIARCRDGQDHTYPDLIHIDEQVLLDGGYLEESSTSDRSGNDRLLVLKITDLGRVKINELMKQGLIT